MDAKASEMAHLGGEEAKLAQEVDDLNKEEAKEDEEGDASFSFLKPLVGALYFHLSFLRNSRIFR